MRRTFASASPLIAGLLLLFGCGAVASSQPPAAAQPTGSTPANGVVQPSREPVRLPAAPTAADARAQAVPGSIAGAPSVEEASAVAIPSAPENTGDPAGWPMYVDTAFGFTLRYPAAYAIVPEPAQPDPGVPDRLKQVRFLDKSLAASDTAQLQPADFAVEVFANTANRSLEGWIDAQAPAGQRTAATISGHPAYLVTLPTQQYPNQFYYVAAGGLIYRVLASGRYAEAMLATMVITP